MVTAGAVVVDASLAVKWVAPEERSGDALLLLGVWRHTATARLAPAWFASEVSNVLYRKGRAANAPVSRVNANLTFLLTTVERREMPDTLVARAVEIASALGAPFTYDALYAVLAEREGCELWTADERFWNTARVAFPFVRWFGNWTPGSAP